MGADMDAQRHEHIGDGQRRVLLQLIHERVAEEAWEGNGTDALLLEPADHVEDVQLARRSHGAGSRDPCEGALLEGNVEVTRSRVRLGCRDEFRQEIRAGQRPEATDDAQRALAKSTHTAMLGAPPADAIPLRTTPMRAAHS